MAASAGETLMASQIRASVHVDAVTSSAERVHAEYKFHPTRRWRFDFAWPLEKVALEVEGGTWSAGRHTRGSGFEKDAEKYNEAAIAGWKVLRVTTAMVHDGRALALLERALA